MIIGVVDSGVANLHSVSNALKHLGIEFRIVETPADLNGVDKIILPGVGAFAAGMSHLEARGFVTALRHQAKQGVPILGICLGMQMLFECSEEMGNHAGLGLLPGIIVRFPAEGPKVPHIGWNQLDHDGSSALLKGVPNGGYAYFVHSFYAKLPPGDSLIASSSYGIDFPAVVGHGNVFGAQFHPEKSQHTGLTLLKNFAGMSTQ